MLPRFVLLRHDCPPDSGNPSHWDFMLQMGEVLWTWQLQELPDAWVSVLGLGETAGRVEVRANRLPDHRLVYLEYEGPVSGDRGTVRRIAAGSYQLLDRQPDRLKVELRTTSWSLPVSLTANGETWKIRSQGVDC